MTWRLWYGFEPHCINIDTAFVFALFYLKAKAPKEVKLMFIYRGVVTFVLLQLFVLALVLFWQALATGLPAVAY